SDSTEPPIWIEAATATIESIDYNGAGVHPDNRMKAAISWAAGVSIYSIYGSEGTIAWFHDSSYTDKWGFVSAEKVDPPEMDDFYDILRADILDAKPAQLGIFYYEPDTSGHAIVCDGWMDTGEYHLNYGWGGFYNAWYRLPEGLPPPMTIVRWAIIDIRPPHRADAGDIHEEAVLIEATSEESFRLDEIYPESDVDWYRCPVVPDSTYIFYTVGATNTRGELFWDSFDEPIIADENSHDALNFRIIFLPDSAGSCHLRVTGAHVGLYQLRYYTYPAPSIVFTMPEGGEVFDEGTTQILRWNREGFPSIPRIDIAYSLDGPAGPWTVFGDSISNSGFHLFDVPNVETSLHDCRIRITEATSDRFEFISEAFTIRDLTGISEIALPTELSISTYPNPFNSSVRIKVESGEWRVENVEIYDLSGRRVGEIPVGEGPRAFPLDGNSENGSAQGRSPTIREFIWQPDESLPSGVFLVRATIAGDKGLKPLVQTKRMVFLK
ncbi:MAG TPA: hypothetical protein ENN07_05925, partial [candidate division Zixibacteria bacterium]|nr:hypothetical protein [candidate division Zixibacteria bacterium]